MRRVKRAPGQSDGGTREQVVGGGPVASRRGVKAEPEGDAPGRGNGRRQGPR